jgi:hypothetical protein
MRGAGRWAFCGPSCCRCLGPDAPPLLPLNNQLSRGASSLASACCQLACRALLDSALPPPQAKGEAELLNSLELLQQSGTVEYWNAAADRNWQGDACDVLHEVHRRRLLRAPWRARGWASAGGPTCPCPLPCT